MQAILILISELVLVSVRPIPIYRPMISVKSADNIGDQFDEKIAFFQPKKLNFQASG